MNVPEDVVAQAYKMASINLSSNVTGQVRKNALDFYILYLLILIAIIFNCFAAQM